MKNIVLSLMLIVLACKTDKKDVEVVNEENKEVVNSKYVFSNENIKVYPKTVDNTFINASLQLNTPDEMIKVGNNKFTYEVNQYDLKSQTNDINAEALANSDKGQHIHFIVDNGPYAAQYDPTFDANLDEGTHIILAFLSRSHHESLKQPKAYVIKQYMIGNNAKPLANIDEDQMLFYSRPKGSYKASETNKILLDFYLVNTTLSEKGNKVKVTVNEDTFMVSKWQPYIIEGLGKGTHSFSITLVDKDNNEISGPFNSSGVRTITIE